MITMSLSTGDSSPKFRNGDKVKVRPDKAGMSGWLSYERVYTVSGMFEPRGDEEVNSWLFELREIPGILWVEWRFELAR